ncbi:MAG: bifunctional protein HldE [Bryobacterales bacterium]|nr:bifunctional protein HldE [Bryobacterales bacterium]
MNIHSGAALPASIAATIPRDGFAGTRVLVVGDLMLDRYILGTVTRISPEAPVPVLAVKRERVVAGGAGNVALNIAGLKAQAILAGVIGADSSAQRLMSILAENKIEVTGIVTESSRPTTCKTRVMCDNHQIVRMDEESSEALTTATGDQLLEKVVAILDEGCHAVILSDYAKGVLGAGFTRKVIAACASRSIPVLVDPKRSDYTPYSGATCITPNLKEFKAASIAIAMEEHEMSVAGFELLGRLQCKSLLVTQGADGMTLFTGEHSYHFPALAEEVFDVSGAGDTVISTVATVLGSGLDMLTAVQLSNIAASLVVRKAGTAPIGWDDLSEVIFRDRERHDSAPSFGPNQSVAV